MGNYSYNQALSPASPASSALRLRPRGLHRASKQPDLSIEFEVVTAKGTFDVHVKLADGADGAEAASAGVSTESRGVQ